jgi:hypothetical protein
MFNLLIFNFPFVVLAVFGPEGFRGHFQPFTDVLREIWPGVTRKMEIFFEQKKTKAAKHPSRSRTQKNSLCFLRCLLSKPSGKIITAHPKTNPPADFSPAGGNLFNVSSVGLDRDPDGRPDHWGQGCRPTAGWRQGH